MNSHDFFRKMVGMVDSVEQGKAPAQLNEAKAPDLAKAGQKAIKNMKAAAKEKKEKEEKDKATNVKESGAEFFRRYSDIIKEAEEFPWHGITDPEKLEYMKNEAQAMDYDEFYDEYSSMFDDPGEFWETYHDGVEGADGGNADDSKFDSTPTTKRDKTPEEERIQRDMEEWDNKLRARNAEYEKTLKSKKGVQEGKIDDLKDAKAAKDEADADDYSKAPKEKKGTAARKVQGKQYGGSKQKDEVEESVAKKKMIGR